MTDVVQNSAKSSVDNFGLFASNRLDSTTVALHEKSQDEHSLFKSKTIEKNANLNSTKQTKPGFAKTAEFSENIQSQDLIEKTNKLSNDNSLTSVFQRLAKKSEPEPAPETSGGSFFKKIFKS